MIAICFKFNALCKSSTVCGLSQNLSHWSFLFFIVLQMNSGGFSWIFSSSHKPNLFLWGKDPVRMPKGKIYYFSSTESGNYSVVSLCDNFISSFLFQNKPMQAPLDEPEVTGALYPGNSLWSQSMAGCVESLILSVLLNFFTNSLS